jgi:cation:H+ antiporter
LDRLDGVLLVVGLLTYTWWCIRQSRRETSAVIQEFAQLAGPPPRTKSVTRSVMANLTLIVLGLALLALGSRWLIDGAVSVAGLLGVSELVIGLTIVAVGTSLPEVVTSIVAAIRGERDIAVGNVVGSNIFNILCVLGISSLIAGQGIAVSSTALSFDIPVMIAVAVACLPIFVTGHVIARWEGGLFFFYYVAYTTYLVLDATGSVYRHALRDVMLLFVVPLTVVTIGVTVWRSRTRKVPKGAG